MEVDISNLTEKGKYDYHLIRDAIDNGNQKAYAELMQRYKEPLFFMLLKMVNNKDDADDLTIEAFGKAFNRLHQYTTTYTFSTWLFKIASNNCIDFIRRKKMKLYSISKSIETEDGGEITVDIKSSAPDPAEKTMRKQEFKMMLEMIDRLKPRYKSLIEMRFFEELSYEEIAARLDIPIGTVKAQLFRARELLMRIYLKTKRDSFSDENY